MWGAGGSLKVTILQSSDSRAFNTTSLTSGLRPGDSTSGAPVLPSIPSKQTLQFFCYICKANCNSQQVPRAGGGWGAQAGLWAYFLYTAQGLLICLDIS